MPLLLQMSRRNNTPNAVGVLHYVTLNVRERKTPFRHAFYAEIAMRELRFECDRSDGLLIAFVIMPDHLHFVTWLRDGNLARLLRRFKPAVTKKLDAEALRLGREGDREWLRAKGRRELWQDGKHSQHLWSKEWIEQKIHYIHANPVRRGLVASVEQYPFSSWAAYSGGVSPVQVDTDWEQKLELK